MISVWAIFTIFLDKIVKSNDAGWHFGEACLSRDVPEMRFEVWDSKGSTTMLGTVVEGLQKTSHDYVELWITFASTSNLQLGN